MRVHTIILFISSTLAYAYVEERKEHIYKPEWNDLNRRPLPKWYDQAKVGISVQWGVFSVPSFTSEWFWEMWQANTLPFMATYSKERAEEFMMKKKSNEKKVQDFMKKHYPPDFTYQDFAEEFKAEFFNATEWANLFKASGAKYVVFTSKHFEGFNMWPSNHSFSWNSMDTGPRRDLVGELSEAVRSAKLKFGVYYALFEWFNPLFIQDRLNGYSTQTFPSAKVWPDLKQLFERYKPSLLWSYNDPGENQDQYWNSTGLFAWLYNNGPNKNEIVINDAWGGPLCNHGDVHYWCQLPSGVLQKHKFEKPLTLDRAGWSWGFRRNTYLEDIETLERILYILIRTVSCGGNFLMNVGATKEGMISPIYAERLMQVGEWLKMNGEAIYDTSPWIRQNDASNGDVWYTCKRNQPYNGLDPTAPPAKGSDVHAVYLITLRWPDKEELILKDIAPFMRQSSNVTLFGFGKKALEWHYIENGARILIKFPDLRPTDELVHKKVWAAKIVFGKGTCHSLYAAKC